MPETGEHADGRKGASAGRRLQKIIKGLRKTIGAGMRGLYGGAMGIHEDSLDLAMGADDHCASRARHVLRNSERRRCDHVKKDD